MAKSTIPNLHRLYRAHVGSTDYRRPERTAFVEAPSERTAIAKIAAAVAAIDGCTIESIAELIYNCWSARECIETGVSEDRELRIFETAWRCAGEGSRATAFVEQPIFLVDNPASLCRAWMRTQEVRTQRNA